MKTLYIWYCVQKILLFWKNIYLYCLNQSKNITKSLVKCSKKWPYRCSLLTVVYRNKPNVIKQFYILQKNNFPLPCLDYVPILRIFWMMSRIWVCVEIMFKRCSQNLQIRIYNLKVKLIVNKIFKILKLKN